MVSGSQKVSYTSTRLRNTRERRTVEEDEKKRKRKRRRRRMVVNGEQGCRRDLWNSKGLGDQ